MNMNGIIYPETIFLFDQSSAGAGWMRFKITNKEIIKSREDFITSVNKVLKPHGYEIVNQLQKYPYIRTFIWKQKNIDYIQMKGTYILTAQVSLYNAEFGCLQKDKDYFIYVESL